MLLISDLLHKTCTYTWSKVILCVEGSDEKTTLSSMLNPMLYTVIISMVDSFTIWEEVNSLQDKLQNRRNPNIAITKRLCNRSKRLAFDC